MRGIKKPAQPMAGRVFFNLEEDLGSPNKPDLVSLKSGVLIHLGRLLLDGSCSYLAPAERAAPELPEGRSTPIRLASSGVYKDRRCHHRPGELLPHLCTLTAPGAAVYFLLHCP